VVIWKKILPVHRARICIKFEQFAPRRASIILSFINTSPAAACFMIIAAHLSEAHSAAARMQRAYSRTNVLTIDLPAHPDRRRRLWVISVPDLSPAESDAPCIREKRFHRTVAACLLLFGPRIIARGQQGVETQVTSGETLDLMHHPLIWEKLS
jgi:hypothetical protein